MRYNYNFNNQCKGGGGTFVVDADLQQPLLIAAGGNGANWYSFTVNG